jgi:hypothetical protein
MDLAFDRLPTELERKHSTLGAAWLMDSLFEMSRLSGAEEGDMLTADQVRELTALRVTPAMEAGLSDQVWGVNEVISLFSAVWPGLTTRQELGANATTFTVAGRRATHSAAPCSGKNQLLRLRGLPPNRPRQASRPKLDHYPWPRLVTDSPRECCRIPGSGRRNQIRVVAGPAAAFRAVE